MIKLKSILQEEMNPKDKREFEAAARGIETNLEYIKEEVTRLVKLLNKEGMRKSANELQMSYKRRVVEFGLDVKNITRQHLKESPNISGNIKWSNPEAMKLSQEAVNKAAKEIGKAQNRAVSIFTSDLKNNKYDKMDLSKAISTGNIRDASNSKREVLSRLFYDVRERFNKYNRRKKN